MPIQEVWLVSNEHWQLQISGMTGNILSLKHRTQPECEFISPRSMRAKAKFSDFWLEICQKDRSEEFFSQDFLQDVTWHQASVERSYVFGESVNGGCCGHELLETDSKSIRWKLNIRNTAETPIRIHRLRVFFPFNQDFGNISQRQMYQNRVLVRYLPAGHSAYQLVMRPNGDGPCLLVLPAADCGFWDIKHEDLPEYAKSNSYIGAASLYLLGRSSRRSCEVSAADAKAEAIEGLKRGSSVVLQPGESVSFSWQAMAIDSPESVAENLVRSGKIAVSFFPGPSTPLEQEMKVAIKGLQGCSRVECDRARLQAVETTGETQIWRVVPDKVGEYRLRVTYGEGYQSEYRLFVSPPVAEVIRKRAEFICTNQFLHDPEDVRNRAILQWDAETSQLVTRDARPHVTGCSDECCLADAVFLAEKNVYWPNQSQIKQMELYVHEFLRCRLQDTETMTVKRWVGAQGEWSKVPPEFMLPGWEEISGEDVDRTFNYVHVANIYFSLYRIGKLYGLIEKATPRQYLEWAYGTIRQMYRQKDLHGLTAVVIGHMGAGNFINIRNALREENLLEEYEHLAELIAQTTDFFCRADYPYGSEQSFDTSGYENIYFYVTDAVERTGQALAAHTQIVRVLKATKGDQPCWFWYGSDARWWDFVVTGKWLSFDETCHHYMSGLNGWALVDHYLRSGDAVALRQGYGALLGILTNVEQSGVAHMAYHWGPAKTGFDPFSGEIGLGLYGYLQGAAVIVVSDETFGPSCYGGEVHDKAGTLIIYPRDGLGRRVYFLQEGIRLEIEGATITRMVFVRRNRQILLDVKPVASVSAVGTLKVTLPWAFSVQQMEDQSDGNGLSVRELSTGISHHSTGAGGDSDDVGHCSTGAEHPSGGARPPGTGAQHNTDANSVVVQIPLARSVTIELKTG